MQANSNLPPGVRRGLFSAPNFAHSRTTSVERCAVPSTKIKPGRKKFEMNASIETSPDVEVAAAQSVDTPKFTFNHIVAPTDFSPNSERAVDYAIQLARRLGAKL